MFLNLQHSVFRKSKNLFYFMFLEAVYPPPPPLHAAVTLMFRKQKRADVEWPGEGESERTRLDAYFVLEQAYSLLQGFDVFTHGALLVLLLD